MSGFVHFTVREAIAGRPCENHNPNSHSTASGCLSRRGGSMRPAWGLPEWCASWGRLPAGEGRRRTVAVYFGSRDRPVVERSDHAVSRRSRRGDGCARAASSATLSPPPRRHCSMVPQTMATRGRHWLLSAHPSASTVTGVARTIGVCRTSIGPCSSSPPTNVAATVRTEPGLLMTLTLTAGRPR